MDAEAKGKLLVENLPFVYWFQRRRMTLDEVDALGGRDDCRQHLCLVFLEACDEAEDRGIRFTTAFCKLARWQMEQAIADCKLVKAPRTKSLRRPESVKSGAAAWAPVFSLDLMHAVIRQDSHVEEFMVAESVRDRTEGPEDKLDTLDAAAQLRKWLAMVLEPGDVDILLRRYGIGCKPQTLQKVGNTMGICKERVRQRQRTALHRLREAAPDLEDLL